jgi:predicted permease
MKRSLRSWLWHVPLEQEVDEELAFHREMRAREREVRLKPDPTEDGPRLEPDPTGDGCRVRLQPDLTRDTLIAIGRKRDREMRLTQWLHELRDDVRFALRQMRRSPGFTAVAALTLALGIGANSAMFALADSVLFRPLPFPAANRLVVVEERAAAHTGALRSRIAVLNIRDWLEQNRTFETLAGVYLSPGNGGPALTGYGPAEIVLNQTVTARFFDVLGVKPLLGRTFRPSDEQAGVEPLVVLSERFWRTRLGADPSIIGRPLMFDGRPRTVVGIVPADFEFVRPSSMWTLFAIPANGPTRHVFTGMRVIGRLRPDVTPAAAQSDITAIADRLARQYGDDRVDRRITVQPFRSDLIGPDLRRISLLFVAIVAIVLFMCCANVANLLLARATGRARELAVRTALGAGRARVVRQILTESLTLAMVGSVAGAGIGAAMLALAPAVLPAGLLPGGLTLEFDGRVVGFCVLAAVGTGIAFGAVPAWQVARYPLVRIIGAGSTRTATSAGTRLRAVLVGAEIAAAVLLLCGGGLLLRTLLTVEHALPGYGADAESVLTMDLTLPARPQYSTAPQRLQFFQAAERQIGAAPGVRSVAWASTLPMGNSQIGSQFFDIVGDEPVAGGRGQPSSRLADDRPLANYQIVSPSYFATVAVPILAGRGFTDRDTESSAPVCVVNEAFVERYLRGQSALGTRIRIAIFPTGDLVTREVVGVARQVKGRADEREDPAQIYVPNTQNAWNEAYLLVRAADRGDAIARQVRAALDRVDPDLPVRSVLTLSDVSYVASAPYRFRASIAVAFAAVALGLALAGIFGVLAYTVEQRSRELGVRIAVGATTAQIVRLVLGSAARTVAAGVVAGVVLSIVLARSISIFLFGVAPIDPVTFLMAIVLIGTTAALAAGLPALRAARIDPIATLRQD